MATKMNYNLPLEFTHYYRSAIQTHSGVAFHDARMGVSLLWNEIIGIEEPGENERNIFPHEPKCRIIFSRLTPAGSYLVGIDYDTMVENWGAYQLWKSKEFSIYRSN